MYLKITIINIAAYCQQKCHRQSKPFARRTSPTKKMFRNRTINPIHKTNQSSNVAPRWISSHLDNISLDFHLMYVPNWKSSWLDTIDRDIFDYEIPNQKFWVPAWMTLIGIEEKNTFELIPSEWFLYSDAAKQSESDTFRASESIETIAVSPVVSDLDLIDLDLVDLADDIYDMSQTEAESQEEGEIKDTEEAEEILELSSASLHQMMLQIFEEAVEDAQAKQKVAELDLEQANLALLVAKKELLNFKEYDEPEEKMEKVKGLGAFSALEVQFEVDNCPSAALVAAPPPTTFIYVSNSFIFIINKYMFFY